jgi:glycosyltransferase involved in cell wall biosynthesis
MENSQGDLAQRKGLRQPEKMAFLMRHKPWDDCLNLACPADVPIDVFGAHGGDCSSKTYHWRLGPRSEVRELRSVTSAACVMNSSVTEVSIVIPIYNEAQTIVKVLNSLKEYFARELSGVRTQIICVDDASRDRSAELIDALPGIELARNKVNRGYGGSLKVGISKARYDNILIMDADGQHRPEYIKAILEKFGEGWDMVVGARPITNTKKTRVLGKWFLSSAARFFVGVSIPDLNSGLRIFKKSTARKYLHLCSNRFSFTTSLTMAYLADELDIQYVPIVADKRGGGKSHVNIKAGLRAFLKILQVVMVFKPLRIMLPLTGFFGLVGVVSFSIDVLDWNISDSTVLVLITTVMLFVFSLLSDQLSSIRRELHG